MLNIDETPSNSLCLTPSPFVWHILFAFYLTVFISLWQKGHLWSVGQKRSKKCVQPASQIVAVAVAVAVSCFIAARSSRSRPMALKRFDKHIRYIAPVWAALCSDPEATLLPFAFRPYCTYRKENGVIFCVLSANLIKLCRCCCCCSVKAAASDCRLAWLCSFGR